MAERKTKVFWTDEEKAKLWPRVRALLAQGHFGNQAMQQAQEELLPPARHRAIKSAALQQLRAWADEHRPAPAAAPPADEARPGPEPSRPPYEPPPPPDPAPAPDLRALLTDLLVEAGRILLADEQFQEIALNIGKRFLGEALRPANGHAIAAQAPAEAPGGAKPRVVVVGLLNGQQAMLEREYGNFVRLNFVPKDHKGEQLRGATQYADAAYVMKFAGHAEWDKVRGYAGENVEVAFMTGIDKLRRALDKHKAQALGLLQ